MRRAGVGSPARNVARDANGSVSSMTRFETGGKNAAAWPARFAATRTWRRTAPVGRRAALYGSVSSNGRSDHVPSLPKLTAGPSAT